MHLEREIKNDLRGEGGEEGDEEGDKETDTCGEIEEEEISRQRDGVREMRLLV